MSSPNSPPDRSAGAPGAPAPPAAVTGAQNDRRAVRNVAVLAFAHAVLGSQLAIHIILGGLAGAVLADDPSLATLPISIVVVVTMLTAPGASLLMGRVGRRPGFLVGAAAGTVGGALAAYALFESSFALFLVASAFIGVYQAFHSFYRFAAADTASDRFKPKAISWVFAGGLVSALIGPELVRLTAEVFSPVPFAGAYLSIVALNLVGACGLLLLDIPRPPAPAAGDAAAPAMRDVLMRPRLLVAMLCGMVGFASMSLVMTSTPLALTAEGFTTADAADVVRWHIVAMFAPSFVTGAVIARLGAIKVIASGLALLAACGAVALAGVGLHHFYVALMLLGIGWNFSFVGATSLLAAAHGRAEQAKVQGLNDFLVFGLVALASLGSGVLLDYDGWRAVQFAMMPALTVCAGALIWLTVHERRNAAVSAVSLTALK